MKAIAIYCGSLTGIHEIFQQAAADVGRVLAQRGIKLIYGGGNVGLMKIVADSVLVHGGEVIGVMTKALVERELVHHHLTQLHIVEDMHQRKMLMSTLADGFIALPGGTGTLDEIYEQWTWAQLGIHNKPCAFLNIADYYQPILAMMENMLKNGFSQPAYMNMLIYADNIDDILHAFHHYKAPKKKWS